jgi:hypothetical protein
MMLLPKSYEFVEMPGRDSQNMAYIRFASVDRSDGVCPVCQRNSAVPAQVHDYLNLGVETVHMPRFVVHGVGHKPYAIEADGAHLSDNNPSSLGYQAPVPCVAGKRAFIPPVYAVLDCDWMLMAVFGGGHRAHERGWARQVALLS